MPKYVVLRPHVDAKQRELHRGDIVELADKEAAEKLKRGLVGREGDHPRKAPETTAHKQAPDTKGNKKSAKAAEDE